MTTAGDASNLKTPPSLSGGDLVSRLLAATPPYLYNVPLTPHSFFFSEMLRSFVQAKSEPSTSSLNTIPTISKRRKRSWKDSKERPLELTTKERALVTHQHIPQHLDTQQEKYFHQDVTESRYKTPESFNEHKIPEFDGESVRNDENRVDFGKDSRNFYDDSSKLFEQSFQERKSFEEKKSSFLPEQKSKMDFSMRNFIPSVQNKPEETQQSVSSNIPPGSDFVPGPLWYPPYPMPQSYPGIDPLHFFIDLRVSGHIWDRKLNERQQLNFKGKHCSAFSVPQSKEYTNRPLNLTRDEANSRKSEGNSHGTHFILKNLPRTYKDIEMSSKFEQRSEDRLLKDQQSANEPSNSREKKEEEEEEENSVKKMSNEDPEAKGKDLRALIGLELVVDYVKEPKREPNDRQ